MNGKINIRVQVRKSKSKSTLSPIYIRVTMQKERFEFFINEYIHYDQWDNKNKMAINNHELNIRIAKSINSVYSKIAELENEENTFTPEQLKDRILGKTRSISLLKMVHDHNQTMESLIPKRYVYGTLKNYKVLLGHIHRFFDQEKVTYIELKYINHRWVKRFETFLFNHTKCQKNGVIKLLQMLKKILSNAHSNGYIKKDPFAMIKFKKEPYSRGFLTSEELKKIELIELHPMLERVRDLFVFSCYTGLSFVDINSLTIDQINTGNDGKLWINIQRKKSGERCDIPLLSKPEKLMQKYKDRYGERVFKKISNQRVNLYLKQIAKLCEIQKRVSFHLARHTFATTITLNNNVPIETVSRVMGHSKISTTQIYAKILEKKIGKDMRSLEF